MAIRIKTIHGVPVPPKKKKPGRDQALTIDFVLVGTVPSKKNRQLATINRNKIMAQLKKKAVGGLVSLQEVYEALKANKPYVRHSDDFQEWEEGAKAVLISQAATWIRRLQEKGYDVQYPIAEASIKIYHYWKDYNRRDNSNKGETIHDLLVAAGIITDDQWTCLSPNEADADCYQGEIVDHITTIQLTAYGWAKR